MDIGYMYMYNNTLCISVLYSFYLLYTTRGVFIIIYIVHLSKVIQFITIKFVYVVA